MRILIIALAFCLILTGCGTTSPVDEPTATPDVTPTVTPKPTATPQPTPTASPTPEPTPEGPPADAVAVTVPHWMMLDLSESMVEGLLYFQSDDRYIEYGETSNTYYLSPAVYEDHVHNMNPTDFGLLLFTNPEIFPLVERIEVNEAGNSIDLTIVDRSYFASLDRSHAENIAFQCIIYQHLMGVKMDDIHVDMHYLIQDTQDTLTISLPHRIRSIAKKGDDPAKTYDIHIPEDYILGDPEFVKEIVMLSDIEDVTINKDGTIDYSATATQLKGVGNDFRYMVENSFSIIIDDLSFVKKIYYDQLLTTMIIEIDSNNYTLEDLNRIQDFLEHNIHLHQLYSGVMQEDISYRIIFIDEKGRFKIMQKWFPVLSE